MGKAELAWLLKKLGITPSEIADPSSFHSRLKVQKAVFLLKFMGKDEFTSYDFGMYLRGPYSTDLARDYYALYGVTPAAPNMTSQDEEILNWFISHDTRWLELASSILSISERYKTIPRHEIFSLLRMSKPWVTYSEFSGLYKELKDKGLVR